MCLMRWPQREPRLLRTYSDDRSPHPWILTGYALRAHPTDGRADSLPGGGGEFIGLGGARCAERKGPSAHPGVSTGVRRRQVEPRARGASPQGC